METIEKKQPPKAKGEAKVISAWGDVEKRRRAVDLGLSGIVLPPYTRKGIATYKGIHMDKPDPSSTFKLPPEPQDILLQGTYKFYDRGEIDPTKRWKLMKNITGAGEIVVDPVTKKQIVEETIEMITMIAGVKTVNIETQYRLYVFMELHPMNATNKFRPNDLAPAFERVDINNNRSAAYIQAEMDLGLEAEMAVMKMTKDEVIGFATTANIPTTEHGSIRALMDVKTDLRVFARKNPRMFFSMANNRIAAVRMNMLDALNFGLIEYNMDERGFFVPEEDKPIFVHVVDEDPHDSFSKYLASDEGKALYDAMMNMIEYWR